MNKEGGSGVFVEEGEVVTLFLVSVFLSSIPEQPKGAGLTG